MSPSHHFLLSVLLFIIRTVGSLFIFAVILRFLLQMVRADFYNPVSQIIIRVTGPALHPLRRMMPGFKGIDMASLILALIAQIILIYLISFIAQGGFGQVLPFSTVFVIAIYQLVNMLLNIYFYSLIILAIASWVAPGSHNPVLVLIHQLIEPITSRVRKFIPPLGGLDFSFMAIILVIIVIQRYLPVLFSGF